MADYSEKLRRWPRIESAVDLDARLNNVQHMRFRDYTRRADPPCHTSSSGLSFQYGDDPGHPGAVIIGCWNLGCQGPGWVDRIEEALGAAIQVWQTKKNGCGDYRYRLWFSGGVSAPAPGRMARKPPPLLAWDPLSATPLEADGFTLADLWAAPVFFAGGGRTKHAVTWKDKGGRTAGYRHSQQKADGGVQVARFGGIARGVRIHPWMSYEDIQEVIDHSNGFAQEGCHPCLSLSGDSATPWPLDVGVIDADYKPDRDPMRLGAAFRDNALKWLTAQGCPAFGSTSGNGFHAVFRLASYQGRMLAPRYHGRRVRAYPLKGHFDGARLEIFAPGDKRLVVIKRGHALANSEGSQPLPMLTWETLLTGLEEAQAAVENAQQPLINDNKECR